MKKSNDKRLGMALALALSLGLAPFSPPHISEKIKWVMAGARGMQPMDYFDLALHSAPWIYLIVAIVLRIKSK